MIFDGKVVKSIDYGRDFAVITFYDGSILKFTVVDNGTFASPSLEHTFTIDQTLRYNSEQEPGQARLKLS